MVREMAEIRAADSCIRLRQHQEKIGLDVYFIAIWLFRVFFLKYLVYIPVPEKESMVICVFLSYLTMRRPMRLKGATVWLCITLLIYYSFDAVWKEGFSQGLVGAIAMISWWICLLVCIVTDRNEREIELLLKTLKWSCILCAVMIALQNPPFSDSATMMVGRVEVNRNELEERVLPGLMIQLIQISRGGKIKRSEFLIAALLFYVCLLPNSRGGFLSLVLVTGCILLEVNHRFQQEHGGRFSGKLLLGLLAALVLLYIILPDEFIARLWRMDQWELDDTGRLSLWREGTAMVTDPIFGMGPSYYELHSDSRWRAYGTHNMFVDIYIAAGIIGLLLIVGLFLSFARRDFLALSFLAMPVARTMVEAGRSYGTWAILAVLGIILNYCDANHVTATELFNKLYARSRKPEPEPPQRATCIRAVRRRMQRG